MDNGNHSDNAVARKELFDKIKGFNAEKLIKSYQKDAEEDPSNPSNSIAMHLYNQMLQACNGRISLKKFVSMLYGRQIDGKIPSWEEMDEEYKRQLSQSRWNTGTNTIIYCDGCMEKEVSADANLIFALLSRLAGIDGMTPQVSYEDITEMSEIRNEADADRAIGELVEYGYINRYGKCFRICTEDKSSMHDSDKHYYIIQRNSDAELMLPPDEYLILKALCKSMDEKTNRYAVSSHAVEDVTGFSSDGFAEGAKKLMAKSYIAFDGNECMVNPNTAFGADANILQLQAEYWNMNSMDALLEMIDGQQ